MTTNPFDAWVLNSLNHETPTSCLVNVIHSMKRNTQSSKYATTLLLRKPEYQSYTISQVHTLYQDYITRQTVKLLNPNTQVLHVCNDIPPNWYELSKFEKHNWLQTQNNTLTNWKHRNTLILFIERYCNPRHLDSMEITD